MGVPNDMAVIQENKTACTQYALHKMLRETNWKVRWLRNYK